MRLGLTEARREVYLNLIQDRHLNKLPKEAQPRSRDSDAILPPGVQLQNYHSMQLRAQPAPDGTLPGSQSPFVVHGQQGTDLRPEASEQPARHTVRVGGTPLTQHEAISKVRHAHQILPCIYPIIFRDVNLQLELT